MSTKSKPSTPPASKPALPTVEITVKIVVQGTTLLLSKAEAHDLRQKLEDELI